jgi:hypothetical protein
MQDEHNGGSLGGEVEVDETFIGGKAGNMRKDRKARVQKEGGNSIDLLAIALTANLPTLGASKPRHEFCL